MRILIIGGTGFIGSVVVQQLQQQGHSILNIHRHPIAEEQPNVQHLLTDRAHLPEFRPRFAQFAPEVVLDMIPYTEQDARTVMNTFRGLARRVVAISSGDVTLAYGRLLGTEPGPTIPVPMSEETPLRQKLYPYRGATPRSQDDPQRWIDDYDKIPVEHLVMSDPTLPGTVLRLPMVYGPGDKQHRLFEYLKRMDDGRPAILLGESTAHWRWTRGYVKNVAAAIALAVTDARAAGRIYHIGDKPTLTIQDWVQAIGQAAGWQGRIVTLPEERLPTHLKLGLNTQQNLLYRTARIRHELAYHEPVSPDESLRKTIAWERAHPPSELDPQLFDYPAEDAALAKAQTNT